MDFRGRAWTVLSWLRIKRLQVRILPSVDAINLRRRARMIDLAREEAGGSFGGMRVAVLGAAFKPNSDDVRDSPALDVAAGVQKRGAAVALYDPEATDNCREKHPERGYRDSAVAASKGADLVLHLTEWTEFREMDPEVFGDVVAEQGIVDGRNALDPAGWRAAGWTYRALGRPYSSGGCRPYPTSPHVGADPGQYRPQGALGQVRRQLGQRRVPGAARSEHVPDRLRDEQCQAADPARVTA